MHRALLATAILFSACTEYDLQKYNEADGVDSGFPAVDSAVPEDEPESEPEPEVEIPVAVCDVTPNPVTPPFEAATWLGEDSYDPDDLLLSYEWTLLTKPSGSAVNMPTGAGSNLNNFVPDLAGDYTAQLIVTNTDGVASDPCEITLESIPAQDLWVEMYWTVPNDDMDLHLIAPGGSFNDNQTDCYYANCVNGGLDWGVRNYKDDDPTLDLDDIDRTGPENINIDAPEESTYTVVVHDYPGSTYNAGNDVTVNIYLNGALVWTDTRVISGESTKTYFAEINWATGTVTGM